VVKYGFYPSNLKKQPFFANNFKIQGGAKQARNQGGAGGAMPP